MSDAAVRALILVVDDVEEDRLYVQSILENMGHEVCVAESAEDGLKMARQRQPSLIVMDVKLPGISGLEATRRLKSDPLTARTPVVVVTAHPLDRKHARDARYDALLHKPINEKEFAGYVSRLLAGESARP